MTQKNIFFYLFLLLGLIIITGCETKQEEKDDKPEISVNMSDYIGIYEGQYIKLLGDEYQSKKHETFSLELKEDGTGIHNHNDSSYSITWSFDGTIFTMEEDYYGNIISYTGTLKKGKIDVFNGDKSEPFTAEYIYLKE